MSSSGASADAETMMVFVAASTVKWWSGPHSVAVTAPLNGSVEFVAIIGASDRLSTRLWRTSTLPLTASTYDV